MKKPNGQKCTADLVVNGGGGVGKHGNTTDLQLKAMLD